MKKIIAKKYIIRGKVQSVGFRPCLYNHAQKLNLKGSICNTAQGVELILQGEESLLAQFWQTFKIPPLAQIYQQKEEIIELQDLADFIILPNQKEGVITATLMEDTTICSSCLKEMFDERNRRYLYPFINCTHCGPRASIIKGLPYERQYTEMQEFMLCPLCKQEYKNIQDRRFYAEPIACADCGPCYGQNIEDIVDEIKRGRAVCLKGISGFHLVADAHHKKGLQSILQLKPQRKKPLALMVLNIYAAQNYVILNKQAQKQILSHKRPIILAPKKQNSLNVDIYKNLSNIGVMLAYAPIHYLIFWHLLGKPKGLDWLNENNDIALIMTSANHSGEPIIYENKKAYDIYEKKAIIATYNRDIFSPSDDSIIRVGDFPMLLRMGRGFSPLEIPIDYESPPILAVGAHLKNSIALAYKNKIYISPYIGSVQTKATFEHFTQIIEKFTHLLDVKPQYIAHDLHPNFLTTIWAKNQNIPTFAFQHHRAHIAAVVAEHNIKEEIIGIALDGFGLGDNKEAWGGEAFYGKAASQLKHISSLQPLPIIGADKVASEPWRMGVSLLHSQGLPTENYNCIKEARLYSSLLQKKKNILYTSALGRYMEGFASLCNLNHYQQYEAEAVQILEAKIIDMGHAAYYEITENNLLSFAPLIIYLHHNPQAYNNIAASIVLGLYEWIEKLAEQYKCKTIILSGGCLAARYLSDNLINYLQKQAYTVFWSQQLPIGDGNIAVGQAYLMGEKLCA